MVHDAGMHPWSGLTDDVRLGVLTEWVTADLVDEVLAERGKRDKKPGTLPARFMVYYVLALALFQQNSYDDVAENLVGALEGMDEAIPNKSSGSAHTDAELALLLAAARERLSPGQGVLDLGDLLVVPARMDEVADWTGAPEVPLPPANPAAGGRPASVAAGGRVVGTSADLLWAVLTSAYARLGFDVLGDDGFRAMVLARIVEPASKAEVVRVLDEIGAPAVSLRTLFRSMARSQARDYRGQLATAAWAHSVRTSGAAALVLYDVTTLHFERGDEDELRKAGVSKEHRVDPQVQAGLLVDPAGFPLQVHLFEGSKAETTTLIPVLSAFAQRHGVRDMVVVADAGMLSAANLNALEDAGFGFIVGSRITK